VADVVAELVRGGVKVRAVEPLRPSLETLYLSAIGGAESEESGIERTSKIER
jgi:hypothetical protein